MIKLATKQIHQDGTTFQQMFEYLVSDGFFWENGEPPTNMEETMLKVLQTLVSET